ncbi:MAG: hypothetical protein Fur0010_15920 [Bdellovibrio sp.]
MGNDQSLVDAMVNLGLELTKKNIGLVYGGGSVGLMGVIADTVLENKGKVWGVIPQFLADWEVAHKDLTHMETVVSMHERKKRMYDLSDAFFVMPGGIGTLDEFFEVLTWSQLNLHKKPIYLINQNGFFDAIVQHLQFIHDSGFLSKKHLDLVRTKNSALDALSDWLSL